MTDEQASLFPTDEEKRILARRPVRYCVYDCGRRVYGKDVACPLCSRKDTRNNG